MSALQGLPGSGLPVDEGSGRLAQSGAERRPQQAGRLPDASLATPVTAAAPAGVQATFSPQSIQVLADAAVSIAGDARACVEEIGQAGVDVVKTTAGAIDSLGAELAGAVTAGAGALVHGVDAARAGVKAVAGAAGDAVTQASGRIGAAAESAVGYAALAALAGGALLNELV